jgi:uncharacterized protein YprB with RNaseH-like and TPR domain
MIKKISDSFDTYRYLHNTCSHSSGKALELLKMYNREDTVNLFDIAEIVYERLRAQAGIEECLSIPSYAMRGQ